MTKSRNIDPRAIIFGMIILIFVIIFVNPFLVTSLFGLLELVVNLQIIILAIGVLGRIIKIFYNEDAKRGTNPITKRFIPNFVFFLIIFIITIVIEFFLLTELKKILMPFYFGFLSVGYVGGFLALLLIILVFFLFSVITMKIGFGLNLFPKKS